MILPAQRSSGSINSKEKDGEVTLAVNETGQDDSEIPATTFKRFSDRFNVWLASRGLEGHGYARFVLKVRAYNPTCQMLLASSQRPRSNAPRRNFIKYFLSGFPPTSMSSRKLFFY